MTLLLDERPVVLQPSLVRRLGILEAAIVQQLHYWSQRATRVHEGDTWVYKTYAEWADEVGVTAKAARGALDRLRRDGVVMAMQNPSDPRDRTLWWRIAYNVINPDDPSGTSSAAAGTQLAVAGIPSAPAGSSNAGAARGRSESTTETTATSSTAHASKREGWPTAFPHNEVGLRVLEVLEDVGRAHGSRVISQRSLGHAMLSAPGRDYLAEAHKMASHTFRRKIVDVVATYRNWLGNAPECYPAVAAAAPNGAQIALLHGGRRDREGERQQRQARRLQAARDEGLIS